MKKFTFLFVLLFTFLSTYAQDEPIRDLKNAFIKAKGSFPSVQKIENSGKLTTKGKEAFKRLIQIINKGSDLSGKTTIAELNSINNAFDSVMTTIGIYPKEKNGTIAIAKIRLPGGFNKGIFNMGFDGSSCTAQCTDVYNNCMTANSCSRDGWICVCCSGCSLAFATCMALCVIE